jgi:hypothetical protein
MEGLLLTLAFLGVLLLTQIAANPGMASLTTVGAGLCMLVVGAAVVYVM